MACPVVSFEIGGQHAKRVRGQEDNRLGLVAHACHDHIIDEIDGIGGAGILG